MRRKITALILAAALCLTLTSCGPKKSGKPYLNKKSPANIDDGFNYKTEEVQTDNFLCYKTAEGELKLFCLNGKKRTPVYDPDGLCDPDPGCFYKIKYDAQHVTGGVGGIHDAYFLCVYSCEKTDAGAVYENGFSNYGSWYTSLKTEGIMSTGEHVIIPASDGGYDLYSPKQGKLHFDEVRNLLIPVTADGKARDVELQLNIFCNKGQTDEYIKEHIKEGKAGDGSFVFIDDYYSEHDDSVYYFDSIENAATADGWIFNTCQIKSETDTDERTRRFITDEELSSKTAEELKLPQDVYDQLISKWSGLKDGKTFWNRYKGYLPQHYDVILFGGEMHGVINPGCGKDLKICLSDYNYMNTDDYPYQYAAVFIISDLNDLIPQD